MDSKNGCEKLQPFKDFLLSLNSAKHENFRLKPYAKVRGPLEFEEQRQHLLELYKNFNVIHSFTDVNGQIFDCVPIDQQPALRKHGIALAQPPTLPPQILNEQPKVSAPLGFLSPNRKDCDGNIMACPDGTVGIRRITLDEMCRFETLDHFFKKSPRGKHHPTSQLFSRPNDPNSDPSPHEYAHAYQTINNLGGHSILNVWSPSVTGNQIFSLSQQWYVATGEKGVQTAEAGWQVFPDKYKDSHPVLFTYWTADGYQSTGSYSNEANDFVQYSSSCPVGAALPQISTKGGDQAEIEIAYVLENGNWWLFVNNAAVGYYPTSLYQNGPLATGATEIDFGGETVGSGSYPPMGSGEFAALGYKQAAYQRNITYFPVGGGALDAGLESVQDWPNSYTIEVKNSTEWGEFFYFGGPGNRNQPNMMRSQILESHFQELPSRLSDSRAKMPL